MQLSDTIRNFVMRNLSIFDQEEQLSDDDNFFEMGFVDSPFAIQLICFLEENFKILIDDSDLDLDNFSSINRIIRFVNKKKAPNEQP